MRITCLLVPVALVALSGCEAGSGAQDASSETAALPSVSCDDVQRLTVRGDATRQGIEKLSGDRARIIATNRATYFAALANVAELKCRTTDAKADGAVTLAFQAVREADRTASEYEKAQKWGMAALYATQAVSHLIKHDR